MKINKRTDYAMRMAACVAAGQKTLTSKEMSETVGVSQDYAVQIAGRLVAGGVFVASKGWGGGYDLARDASAVSLLDIAVAMGNAPSVPSARTLASVPSRTVADTLRLCYEDIERNLREVLSSATLDDLVQLTLSAAENPVGREVVS
ncbi:RrF2 family transcriptional regulator [Raoultibacter timonensis]|uniref:BadM/Rrf2 family transcriptional regulator n=1 Tax=Raoultibacter timonensis TaxID=1907662 RepID=A0ABN6MDG5_9ACTN|nr:Rrf2 family transcriptional regulator [Raoultibacter timonensis]BDE94726.1 hypothetical protein CE91St30_00590 [Raoultibacter timonensis]BDF49329.1 hypothetical protein CE91St31_00590 [Raoultibacter timonensis]